MVHPSRLPRNSHAARLPTSKRNDLPSQGRYVTLTGARSVRQPHSEPERSAARVDTRDFVEQQSGTETRLSD
jgi:hypothetical protein